MNFQKKFKKILRVFFKFITSNSEFSRHTDIPLHLLDLGLQSLWASIKTFPIWFFILICHYDKILLDFYCDKKIF